MRGPHPTGRLIALFLLVLLFAAALPLPQSAAAHNEHFAVPKTGMRFGVPYGDHVTNATFPDEWWGERRLVGYLQERDTITVDVESPYSANGWVIDQATGHFLGYTYQDSWQWPAFYPIPESLLRKQQSSSGFITIEAGVFWLIPETVLWGRYLEPGDSWEVVGHRAFCDSSRQWVDVSTDASNVTVSSVCTRENTTYTSTWILENPRGASPFGSERTHLLTRQEDGVVVSQEEQSLPITVYDEGQDPIFFGGSEEFVIRDRDQTFRYGPLGLIPYDPDPLPAFDVAAAARAALQHEGAALRSFFAQADDPRMVAASVRYDERDSNLGRWYVTFADAHNRSVIVSFLGLRTEVGMLMFDDRSYSSGGHRLSPDRDASVFAAPGDVARATLQVFEERGFRTHEMSWRADPFPGFDLTGRDLCDQTVGGSWRVGVSLKMGTVQWVQDRDAPLASDLMQSPYDPVPDCIDL